MKADCELQWWIRRLISSGNALRAYPTCLSNAVIAADSLRFVLTFNLVLIIMTEKTSMRNACENWNRHTFGFVVHVRRGSHMVTISTGVEIRSAPGKVHRQRSQFVPSSKTAGSESVSAGRFFGERG